MGHCSVLVCPRPRPRLRTDPSLPPSAPSARSSLFKWILSLLVCCWNSRPSSRSSGDSEEGIEMGPMTLREYINTLEPYNPEVHGWRGDEPWRRPSQLVHHSGASSPRPQHDYSSVSYQPRKCSNLYSQTNQIV